MEIRNSDLYVPFYDHAVSQPLREALEDALFIEIYLKGGRFSGKSFYFVDLILELSYKDPARSSVIIANHISDHHSRAIRFFDKVLGMMGLTNDWKWTAKKTRPKLTRKVNGYLQEIEFLSLADLENAGFEPPINETTGKAGYYGIIWADEVAKKKDSSPDADFEYIERLKDAITTAKNSFIRHLENNGEDKEPHPYGKQNIITMFSLNPWGGENPIVVDFHKHLDDDVHKLVEKGYNLAYYRNDNSFKVFGTTNYLINTMLNEEAKQSVEEMRGEDRAMTMIYGVTGRTNNSTFGRQLDVMEGLNRAGNVPKDEDFIPKNLSLDVGSTSAMYMNGWDARYTVSDFEDYYPTRLITKGEWYSDIKTDVRSQKERWKSLLKHIHQLAYRFPEIRREGITLWVDASATDTIDLLAAYANEMLWEDATFDVANWLNIKGQSQKWSNTEKRHHREERYAEMIGAHALIVDKNECPNYYKDLHRIVSKRTMDLHDHCWDAHMYGIMSLYKGLYHGLKLKAFQGKPDTIIEEKPNKKQP